jgi:hypothetical protein
VSAPDPATSGPPAAFVETPIFDQLTDEFLAGPDTPNPRHRRAEGQPDPMVAPEVEQ